MAATAGSAARCLQSQVAVVTGGARGIGAAISRRLAAAGATVSVLDVIPPDEVCHEITAAGGDAHGIQVDLADRGAVRTTFDELVRRRPVDVLVNNAGVVSTAPFAALTDDEWDRVVEINLTAAMVTTRAVWPGMVSAGGGRLVYVGSRAARTGGNNAGPAYVASKGAIHALTIAAAKEGAPHGIRANAVMPGPVRTDLTDLPSYADESAATPMGRMGTPDDIAEAALYLASPSSDFVTGTALNISGGLLMG